MIKETAVRTHYYAFKLHMYMIFNRKDTIAFMMGLVISSNALALLVSSLIFLLSFFLLLLLVDSFESSKFLHRFCPLLGPIGAML